MRPWLSRSLALLGLLLAIALAYAALPSSQRLVASSTTFHRLEPALDTQSERGIATFAFGDWGSLSTDTLRVSASPWKLSIAAMTLAETNGDANAAAQVDLVALFERFGFLTPARLANWPKQLPPPALTSPLGQNVGSTGRAWPPLVVTVGNVGCPACHAGVVYDDQGTPDPTQAWLGSTNSSINLELYTQTLFQALREYADRSDLLLEAVSARYPQTGWRERLTLRYFVLPQVRKTVAERDALYEGFFPFRISLAGATNGLDSLRHRNGLIAPGERVTEGIFNSIPDLGGRLWRVKLLNSGSYAIPGAAPDRVMTSQDLTAAHRLDLARIIAYFTVPSMGVTPAVAEAHIDDANDVTTWMLDYAPQPFPGEVDSSLAAQGRLLYRAECATCHGTYDDSLTNPSLTRFPNWEGDVGTDTARAQLLTQAVADSVNNSRYGRYIDARLATGYAAPPLEGLWSSAPYLHNGSVPTLWHLLRPARRPATFFVGGHRIDLTAVGIDLQPPNDYLPWATPVEINTMQFGLGNGGHRFGEGLDDDAARALLEYLKLL